MIRFVKSEAADIKKIYNLEALSYPDPYSKNLIEKDIDSFYSLFSDDIFAGYINIGFGYDFLEIYRITTAPDFRSKGLARLMLSNALSLAREYNNSCPDDKPRLCGIILEVRSRNTAAIKLYESFGFIKTGLRKNYYNNPNDDAVLYNKKII